jgi:sugar/nucleoside kinase (ribokinase family)
MAVSSHYPDAGLAESLPGPLPEGTGIVLVDGFLRAVCHEVASSASTQDIPVVLDGGSWKGGMDEWLPMVDVAVCSAVFFPPGTSTHGEALDYLQDLGVDRVAITRGGESILYRDGSDSGRIPVEAGPVVDTLGAGDILHGALCWFLADGRPFPEALAEAAAVATRSCRSFGTRDWMESEPG